MKAPISWIREYVDLPESVGTEQLAERLTELGLKLEAIERPGHDITGPLVLGRVLSREPEPQKNGKTINWCSVDVADANGTGDPQGIVCGAHNFDVGDLVVVVLPGATLPGGFEIAARKTYGHVSAGMICSAAEVGLPEAAYGSAEGIMVLPSDAGRPGDDAFAVLAGLRDEVIEFEINPDRAYALSLRGVARESGLGFDAPFTDPAAVPDLGAGQGAGHPVEVDDPAAAPVFVTRTVTGIDPTRPSPLWMQRRIQLAGMRPISLAVDITNYVMLELGQPIHGYDADKLTGPIRVRRAAADEQLTTLDGTRRVLAGDDILITDDTGPIGLAGVMGGETTELSETTRNVVIEAAHFDPASIFRTQRRHKLPSEASKRFERGTDPAICSAAADRVAQLLIEHGGGALGGRTVVGRVPDRTAITIDVGLPARVTGLSVDPDTVPRHLSAVGCELSVHGDELTAIAPTWRPDLSDPYDLVEEVARIVGYENVPSILPQAPAGRGLTSEQRLRRRVSRAAAADGFVEVLNFPFVGQEELDKLELAEDDERRRCVRLANPLRAEQPLMTTTVLPGLLGAAARNIGRGLSDLALFELTTVTLGHHRDAAPILGVDQAPSAAQWQALNSAVPDQPYHLGLVLCGERERSGWWGPGRPAAWADAVSAAHAVARSLGVELEVVAADTAPWHRGRCAELRVDGAVLGHAGELHPRVCKAFAVPPRSAAAEIDISALIALAPDVVAAPVFSSFPVAKEDVALVVDVEVAAESVASALRAGAGELCESVRLFDVYSGDQIAAGKKSLAFALRFRAADRTLTEAETAASRDAAVARAGEVLGAVQRS